MPKLCVNAAEQIGKSCCTDQNGVMVFLRSFKHTVELKHVTRVWVLDAHLAARAAARALQGAGATVAFVADLLAGVAATVKLAATHSATLEWQMLAGHLSSLMSTQAAVPACITGREYSGEI